jgi:dihydroorotate dehydrogenase (fumarate)
LYLNGLEQLEEMQGELRDWMGRQGYSTLDAFRGKMSQSQSANPAAYERVQFMKRSVTGIL